MKTGYRQDHMLAFFASIYPSIHSVAGDTETQRIARSLNRNGFLEINAFKQAKLTRLGWETAKQKRESWKNMTGSNTIVRETIHFAKVDWNE